MRWENLSVENEVRELSHLPGFRDPAVVRRFDAPEAMGIRFHEINARSAINEVPKASRMPFRYTINPYRGCAHGCPFASPGPRTPTSTSMRGPTSSARSSLRPTFRSY